MRVQRCPKPAANQFNSRMAASSVKWCPFALARNCLDVLQKLHGDPSSCTNSVDPINTHAISTTQHMEASHAKHCLFEKVNLVHVGLRLCAGLMTCTRCDFNKQDTSGLMMIFSEHCSRQGICLCTPMSKETLHKSVVALLQRILRSTIPCAHGGFPSRHNDSDNVC